MCSALDRKSPSFHLMEKLEEKGAVVSYDDPFMPEIGMAREFAEFAGRKSVAVTDEYDAILIATAHDDYRSVDFSKFKCPMVDTRYLMNGRAFKA